MNQRGIVMAMALGVVVVVTTLGAAFLLRSLHESLLGNRHANRQAAFYLAEAGLDRASINLRTPTDATDDVLTQTLSTGTLQIESTTELQPQVWRVISRGTSQGEVRRIEAVYQLTPQSAFQWSLFGSQQVNVSGNAQTDSYDSRIGPYSDPGNKAQNGDLGTNATTPGGITVSGSIFIEGQVAVGSNVPNPTSVVTGYSPAFITGNPTVVSQSSSFPMPPVTVPAGLTCGDLTIQGNTTTSLSPTGGPLGNGTYCYSNLTLSGGSTLTASGSVTVYLTGQLVASGNSTVGVPATPKNMLFLMDSTAGALLQNGTLSGSTKFYGAVYGPQATITISGNADVYGSIIGKQINVTGSASIHYDEALTDLTTISNLYQRSVVSWRDLN